MTARLLTIITILIIFLALVWRADPLAPPPPPVELFLSHPTAMWPNGYFRVRIRVEPHDDNRWLVMGYDGPESHVSYEMLDGAAAPITRWREFKDLPPGEYQAIAELYRVTNGKEQLRTTRVGFRVLGGFE